MEKPQEADGRPAIMASHDDLLAAGGVLAILLGGIVYNHFLVARGARPPRAASATASSTLGSAPMLGRYASHRGHVVGEVVAITTDRLILRQSGIHKAVALSKAKLRDGDVTLDGDIDWTQAEDEGRAWAGLDRDAAGVDASATPGTEERADRPGV